MWLSEAIPHLNPRHQEVKQLELQWKARCVPNKVLSYCAYKILYTDPILLLR